MKRVKRGWMNLRVTKVVSETHDTNTFELVDADDGGRSFDYDAGQYLTFRFDELSDKPLVRSYTLSSSPNQGDFCAFTVKRVESGSISNWLCDNVKVGSILRARGPIGKFCWEPGSERTHLFMVAGGSGVTPFASIMREYAGRCGAPGAPGQMTLLVSYRTSKDLILWDDLQKINAAKNCRVFTTLSREDMTGSGFLYGRIDQEMLLQLIGGAQNQMTFMTCGPTEIMDLTVATCRAAGVPEPCIRTESFY